MKRTRIVYPTGGPFVPFILSAGGGGGAGTVTSVTSANADLTIATTTTTPVITVVQTPALRSATTTINISSATAPTAGQVLTATSSTAATWQTPAGGGSGSPAGSSGQMQYNNAGSFAGAAGQIYSASGSINTLCALAATDKPLVVKGFASQSANLQDWQNSAGTILSHVSSDGYMRVPAGATATPSLSYSAVASTGIGFTSYGINFNALGTKIAEFHRDANPSGLSINSAYFISWNADTVLGRAAAATLQLGRANVLQGNQTIKAADATGTNVSGDNFILSAGVGTGTGTGGTIIFKTAPVLASGTTAQTLATVLTLNKDASAAFGGVVRLKSYTVSTLPTGTLGDTAFVTDALTPTLGNAVAGGGAVNVKVWYNGTAWTVTGV